ncbi:MAG: hypothetical protein U0169_03235 [Polyangiaceae bacterium]
MTSLGADPAPSGRPTYDVLAVLAKKGDAPAVDPMLDPADFSHGELAEYNQFRVLDRKNDTEIAAGSALVVNAGRSSSSSPSGTALRPPVVASA